MKGPELALILTGVLLNAVAQLLLKAGARAIAGFEFTPANALAIAGRVALNAPIIAKVLLQSGLVTSAALIIVSTASLFAWLLTLLGYVVNALAAAWLFGEPLGALRVAGIGVIIIGVWMVARS